MPSTLSEVLLLGPGPSPVAPATLAAMSQPLLGHLDPEFLVVMDQVQADLRKLFHTENSFTLPVSGTGSAGMEICLTNLVEAGDPVPGDAPFDLMTADLPGTHARFVGAGLDVSDVVAGDIHSVFVLTDPDGYRIVVYDDHTVGPV